MFWCFWYMIDLLFKYSFMDHTHFSYCFKCFSLWLVANAERPLNTTQTSVDMTASTGAHASHIIKHIKKTETAIYHWLKETWTIHIIDFNLGFKAVVRYSWGKPQWWALGPQSSFWSWLSLQVITDIFDTTNSREIIIQGVCSTRSMSQCPQTKEKSLITAKISRHNHIAWCSGDFSKHFFNQRWVLPVTLIWSTGAGHWPTPNT